MVGVGSTISTSPGRRVGVWVDVTVWYGKAAARVGVASVF
jgi:hypothetical protein